MLTTHHWFDLARHDETDPGTPPTDPPADPPTDPPPADPDLGDAGKKAIAAERDARRRAEQEAAAAKAKVKEYEDRDLTEQQKLEARAKESEEAATAATLKALRYEVAVEKGLPLTLASRLQGNTPEELAADAEALLELVPPAKPGTPPPPPGTNAGGPPPAPPSFRDAAPDALAAELRKHGLRPRST